LTKEKTMNGKYRNLIQVVAAAALALAVTAFFSGCSEEEPTAEQSARTSAQQLATTAQEAAATAPEKAEDAILQESCPVMGGPINKAIFVEYEGKKVYFCCKGCETEFNKDPEKYVAKLPQFQQ
jgi:YHS domain-containing protein